MPTTKVDYKRELRELYSAKAVPKLVEVPELSFLMIDGHGDPNTSRDYEEAIGALYSIAYAAKFAVKNSGGGDVTVMPLEGLWWADDFASFTQGDRDAWSWRMMIMQPEQVTDEVFAAARERAGQKDPHLPLDRLRLERRTEGAAAQILHVGPWAEEGPTIERLHAFITERGYALRGEHHEIYLSDPRRTTPDRLKTILRQPVAT